MNRTIKLLLILLLISMPVSAQEPVLDRPSIPEALLVKHHVDYSAETEKKLALDRQFFTLYNYSRAPGKPAKLITSGSIYEYLQKLWSKLLAEIPASHRNQFDYRLFLLDIVQPVAFADLGGYVYISVGELVTQDSEESLVGTLSHELGHAMNRDVAGVTQKKMDMEEVQKKTEADLVKANIAESAIAAEMRTMSWNQTLACETFRREGEKLADRIGVRLMMRAGYDPTGRAKWWLSLPSGDQDNTHPPNTMRAQIVLMEMHKAMMEAPLWKPKPHDKEEFKQIQINASLMVLSAPLLTETRPRTVTH